MVTLETVQCGGITLQLPTDLCRDFSLLMEVISPETWNNHLTDDNRETLMSLLPSFPENDLDEKTRTLEMFFMDVNFRYGTPLRQFHGLLKGGFFGLSVISLRKRKRRLDIKLFKHHERAYLHNVLEATIVRRQELLDNVSSLPPPGVPMPLTLPPPGVPVPLALPLPAPPWRPPLEARAHKRYLRELQALQAEAGVTGDSSDEDTEYRSVSKKQRKQLCGVEGSLPPGLLPIRHTHSTGSLAKDLELLVIPQQNTLDLTDVHFQAIMDRYVSSKRMRRKKGMYSLSCDTRGVTLSDVISRASQSSKRLLLPPAAAVTSSNKAGNSSRAKAKKEKQCAAAAAAAVLVKEECVEGDERAGGGDVLENGHDEPCLTRYVTLASGEVKNDVPHQMSEEKEDDRPTKGPPVSTAKRKLPCQTVRRKGDPTNGDATLAAVKEEPPDVAGLNSWDTGPVTAVTVSQGILQQRHACFFCLVRDIICQPREQRLSRAQLESSVRAWQHAPAARLNAWYDTLPSWLQVLPSAVNFLAGFGGEGQPSEFVPYLEYKVTLQAYQWIGAGRDNDANLHSLCHHWIINRSLVCSSWLVSGGAAAEATASVAAGDEATTADGDDDSGAEEVIPGPRCPTTWTVQPATPEERAAFRQQEKLRYEKPHRAFTYKVHGYEAVVGPVKGIYSQHSGPNKARGHSLLTPHRPAYVTILALVRDAVARLPNGEGTRAEICELLRESQYLAPLHNATAESALNSVVSGALDRLHYEQDPCVKYLANRKMWVYLHRNRDEREFERMHHLNGPGSTKNKKPPARRTPRPKTPAKEATKPPPNVAIDPLTNVVKVDGGLVQVRPEDVLVRGNNATVAVSSTNGPTNIVSLVSSSPTTVVRQTAPLASTQHNKMLTAVKVTGGSNNSNIRTLMASNLQTIQVSTTSGIHTIKVALPPGSTPAQHFAKGTLVGRLTGNNNPTTPKKEAAQTIGQILQTTSGTQFISTGVRAKRPGQAPLTTGVVTVNTSGALRPIASQAGLAIKTSSPSSPLLKQQQQQQTLLSAQNSGTIVINRSSGGLVSRGGTAIVSNSGGTTVLSRSPGGLMSRVTSVVSHTMPAVSRTTSVINQRTAVTGRNIVPLNTVTSGTMTGMRPAMGSRVQSISAHQLAGLKLLQAPHTLQHGVGQKLVMQGNKVLVQQGKVVSGGLQQLMTVQQQPITVSGGVQRVTLVSSAGSPITTTTTPATATQRLVLGQQHTTLGQCGSAGPLLSLGGKQVLLATKSVAGDNQQQQLTSLGQVLLTGDKLGQMVANIGGQQLVLTAPPSSGQQLMVPASALQGGQISLKGLQAFHTLKVIPGGTMLAGKNKPVVTRVVQQPRTTAGNTGTPTTSNHTRPADL